MIEVAEYRRLYESALGEVPATGFWDGCRRWTIEQSWNYIRHGDNVNSATDSYLAVNIGRAGEAPSLTAVQALSKAIQDATARLSWARRRRKSRIERLSHQALRDSQLTVPLMVDGLMYLDLKRPPHPDGALEDVSQGNWAELGLLELCQTLPETREDDAAVNAILSANQVVRRAMADITKKAGVPDLEFLLHPKGRDPLRAVLTQEQSRKIRTALSEKYEERGFDHMSGYLDGMRTKRRRFYLELPDGREREGSVEPAIVDKLQKYVGENVIATVEVTTIVTESGSRSQERYNLVGVRRRRRTRSKPNGDELVQETLFGDQPE